MTTWRDYNANPELNNSPPPAGAPEFMPTTQVNNVQREVMSVIRQMGDEFDAGLDALGTMAAQNSDNVAITGGSVTATLAGPGAGITNLKAQNLIEGPIPKTIFPADATPLDVKVARAATADQLGNKTWLQLMPVGTIILWWGNLANAPAGWQLCNGTNGTPDLRGRMVLGAHPGNPMGETGGAWQATVGSTSAGAHSHGGSTAGLALSVAQMPSHSHTEFALSGGGGGFVGPQVTFDGTTGHNANISTLPNGGGQAHAHGIGADGNHVHNVTVPTVPVYTALYYLMRVS